MRVPWSLTKKRDQGARGGASSRSTNKESGDKLDQVELLRSTKEQQRTHQSSKTSSTKERDIEESGQGARPRRAAKESGRGARLRSLIKECVRGANLRGVVKEL